MAFWVLAWPDGIKCDRQDTLDALRRAAQKGDAATQLQLGDVFRTGQGLPQDFGEAVKWYRLAPDQGNTAAQINLGTMYHLGLGVPVKVVYEFYRDEPNLPEKFFDFASRYKLTVVTNTHLSVRARQEISDLKYLRGVFMWILKGTFLGLLAFAVFAVSFLRNYQVRDGRISLIALRYLTIQNPWFWAAFVLIICTCCVCVRIFEIPRSRGEVAVGSERVATAHAPPGLQNPHMITPPQPFGYKTAWFAVRSDDMNAVAKAIEMQQPEQVNWQYGIFHAHEYNDYQTFVTPPVQGWVLAVGMPILWDIDSHADERLIRLSKQFGEAQLFGSVRTSDAYLWAEAVDGKLVRFFYYADGEQRRQIGDITDAEKQVGVKFFDATSPESGLPGYWQRKDLTFLDERHVLKIAAKWSIDPSKLDEMGLVGSLGLLGTPSGSYPPKPNPIHQ